jgi:hypothetical protein
MRRWLLVLVVAFGAVACSGGGSDGPSASLTTPPSTEAQTVEQEVEAAYLRSWDVYAEAMLELDPSGLDRAFAKKALDLRKSEVDALRAKGTPARMRVDHRVAEVSLREDVAYVTDNYTNHSVVLDPKTREPAEPDPNSSESRTYTLERIEGAWRVVFVLDNSPG